MLLRKLYAPLVLVCLLFVAASSTKLKPVNVMAGKATLQIPKDIVINEQHNNMDAMDGFTNASKTMRFSYIVYGKIGDKTIKARMTGMEQEFVYRPKHKMISKGIESIDGNDVAYFYIETKDGYKNNLIFATDVAGELVAFIYASNNTDQSSWKETSKKIMQSLRFN